jgi:hypothetical protein
VCLEEELLEESCLGCKNKRHHVHFPEFGRLMDHCIGTEKQVTEMKTSEEYSSTFALEFVMKYTHLQL